jgi:hypothetical protein
MLDFLKTSQLGKRDAGLLNIKEKLGMKGGPITESIAETRNNKLILCQVTRFDKTMQLIGRQLKGRLVTFSLISTNGDGS